MMWMVRSTRTTSKPLSKVLLADIDYSSVVWEFSIHIVRRQLAFCFVLRWWLQRTTREYWWTEIMVWSRCWCDWLNVQSECVCVCVEISEFAIHNTQAHLSCSQSSSRWTKFTQYTRYYSLMIMLKCVFA